MKDGKLGTLLLGVYALAGVATGITFGKAMYHKGKAEVYDEVAKDLEKLAKETEEIIAKKEAEEAE